MARGPRIQFEGALYHVINRGNYQTPVFADDSTTSAFVACLMEGCERAGWILHALGIERFQLADVTLFVGSIYQNSHRAA